MTQDLKIDVANVLHDAGAVRKAAETDVKRHINAIWQKLEDAAEWPVERLEALVADLKKHV